jgi:hypothetical protein
LSGSPTILKALSRATRQREGGQRVHADTDQLLDLGRQDARRPGEVLLGVVEPRHEGPWAAPGVHADAQLRFRGRQGDCEEQAEHGAEAGTA